MGWVSGHFRSSPTSTTTAAAALSTTTLATAITVATHTTDVVCIEFENNTDTAIHIVRVPLTVNNQGTTVLGTAVYHRVVPANTFRVIDLKSNAVVVGPTVWKAFAAATPASGTLQVITWPHRSVVQ